MNSEFDLPYRADQQVSAVFAYSLYYHVCIIKTIESNEIKKTFVHARTIFSRFLNATRIDLNFSVWFNTITRVSEMNDDCVFVIPRNMIKTRQGYFRRSWFLFAHQSSWIAHSVTGSEREPACLLYHTHMCLPQPHHVRIDVVPSTNHVFDCTLALIK